MELRLPNWNPGSYKIRDFAAHVDSMSVTDQEGHPLPFFKVRKNAWIVEVGDATVVQAEYDVFAGQLSVRSSWVSEGFILINPVTAILYTERSRAWPQRVEVSVPDGLGRVYSSLIPGDSSARWMALSYDELVDSPLVISDGQPANFEQDGRVYHLLDVGDDTFWDSEQALESLQPMVAATNALWGVVPLERDYWFFNLLVEGRGGLEHDHNTVMMTSRWNTRKREDFINWLSLAAHEYIHVWNVRRMRPAGIGEYDFEKEQYSPSLWIAEGLTSYYDNLLLSRAGLISIEEYFRLLAKDLHRLELTPGRQRISLRQASRDAWIRQYGDSPNRVNSNISYYTKGAVVGFALDARIRDETKGRRSLDDVMRLMYRRWADKAFPEQAFPEAVAEIAGDRVRRWLEPLLDTTQDPDVDDALSSFGLTLERHPDRVAAELSGEHPGAGLGLTWKAQSDELVVATVAAGTAASQAGVLPGDELLAIGGQRLHRDNYEDKMSRLAPGESVELLLSRHGTVFTLAVKLDPVRPQRYEIRFSEEASSESIERLQTWLGQELNTDSLD